MNNIDIAKLLRDIAASYTIKNENKYRFQIIAYQKAADTIEASTSEIKDLYKENKLGTLPGVGPSIKKHLEELLKTGKVKHFEWVLRDIPKAVFPLLDIPSFGPKKAYKLVSHFNLRNQDTVLEDIENLAKKNLISPLDGFGEKSQNDIVRALSEYKLGRGKTKRMVLPFAFELAQKLVAYMKESKAVIDVHPLGSLRRMAPTIGDIDLAVATDEPKKVIDHFVNYPYKDRVIEKGDATSSILVSSGKQIDLMTHKKAGFGSLLQHFTGSKNHNIHLRELALRKGLSLNEYGIRKIDTNKMEYFDTEDKFYKAIGLQWITPELREDKGEIERALQNKLPKLIELSDIKGDLHIHSDYPIEPSHDLGKDTMKVMMEKANSLGYEYIGFSEHNPSVSKHSQNEIYNILSRRNENIEQIKMSNKNVRVIKLLEIDILVNGILAINDKCLSLLDGVIVSIHSSFSMDQKTMTKRILNGLSHPKAKIFAHPTGRLLNQRGGYQVNFDTFFEFCKKNNKALEINAWPSRLDLPDPLVKEAISHGIKFVINTDSHAVDQMDNMRFGISVARRGWAEKRDILNTLEYNTFIDWLKS